MHRCAQLFDRFFLLVEQEKEALNAEDMDKVDALTLERAELLEQAWREREGYDEDTLRMNILKAGECQEKLVQAATALHNRYREQQKNGRKQARYFDLDRNLHQELQKSFYCDKLS